MEPRQLAMDPPPRSAALTLGRHLLGRIYKPDPRDWKLSRLMELAEPGDGTLDMTVQQVLDQTPYFTTWPNYLVFWRWVKQQKKGPKPAPTGDTTPGWDLKIQLDQGQTGHCVGFGWAGWVNATPVEGNFQNADGHAIYYECKVIDGEPLAESGCTFGPVRSLSATAAGSPHSPSRRTRTRSTTGSTTMGRSSSGRPGPTTCSTPTRTVSSSRRVPSRVVTAT